VGEAFFPIAVTQEAEVANALEAFGQDVKQKATDEFAGVEGEGLLSGVGTIVLVTEREAGEPEHVMEAVTGHLSRRMLEHYSHQRLKAKGQMLARMEERRKKESA